MNKTKKSFPPLAHDVWRRSRYECPQSFVGKTPIYEYDIRNAGASISRELGITSSQEDIDLSNIPKHQRHIKIGYMRRKDVEFSENLSDGFVQARKNMMEANNLDLDSLVEVRNDAIYTTRKCDILRFGYVRWTLRKVYVFYMRFSPVSVYISENLSGKSEDKHSIISKGLGSSSTKFSMIEGVMVNWVENLSLSKDLSWWRSICTSYKHRTCPEEMYREYIPDGKIIYNDSKVNILYNWIHVFTPLTLALIERS